MAHNVEKMMFTGKRPWWYGNAHQGTAVGVDLGENAVTSAVAMKEAGLDWEVILAQAGFQDGRTFDVDGNPIWRAAGKHRLLVRSSDFSVLGSCSDKYQPIQNRDAFEFLDSFVEDGELLYHTAGSLEGGKKVWILAQTPDTWTIKRRSGREDRHHAFLLNILGHDSKFGYQLLPTDVRAECANTVGMAQEGAELACMSFNIGHTGDVAAKMKLAATAIKHMATVAPERRAMLQALAQAAMTSEEFIEFATSVFLGLDGEPGEVEEALEKFGKDANDAEKKRMLARVAPVAQLFETGIGLEGDSAYDALQAFTEYFDHFDIGTIKGKVDAGKKAARAVTSSWLGIGAERKALAMKRLVERVRR